MSWIKEIHNKSARQETQTIGKILRKWGSYPWLAPVLSFSGAALYFIQAWVYAHIQTSFLDEGGYLYVGDLYARGIIKPFQDYAIPRWYAPLAYLIPGQIEKWFGASLLTGRYFSVFCGLLMLIPLWITARRFAGKWWGAAIIWGMALTPISIQIYSLALSQALVACLLAWALMFVLGEKRPLWQIITGAFLAGLLVMTRHNLAPVVPLLVAYVFWQHGKKAGWWALTGCLLPILVIHAIYWPNILQLWALWLPASLTPFLDAFQFPVAGLVSGNSSGFSARLLAFVQGFRFAYFAMLGFVVTLFLWPRNNTWKSQAHKRAAYFLAALFLVLGGLHLWATLMSSSQAETCTFCFTPYLAFFDITALLLITVTFSSWRKRVTNLVQYGIVLFVVLLASALGYASYERFGPWLLGVEFPAFTRGLDPRHWVPFINLWDILANKFHLDYWKTRVPLATIAGLILGILLLVFGRLVYKRLLKSNRTGGYSFGASILIFMLSSGVLLSPLMVGDYRQDGICRADIPKTYAQIGEGLTTVIPPGSQVYWEAKSAVPLLYTPQIQIYLPQIYWRFSFRLGGDSDSLLKNGLWNDKLAEQWRAESDYIVTEVNWYQIYRPGGDLDTTQFVEYDTLPANPCDPYSYLIIYKRKP
jgi:hypothetical protein